jgi:hypothetical protein
MSQENVEIVRRAGENFNAFMRGELPSEGLAVTLDPQIEVHWRDKRTYPDTRNTFEASESCLSSRRHTGARGPTSSHSNWRSSTRRTTASCSPSDKAAEAGKAAFRW